MRLGVNGEAKACCFLAQPRLLGLLGKCAPLCGNGVGNASFSLFWPTRRRWRRQSIGTCRSWHSGTRSAPKPRRTTREPDKNAEKAACLLWGNLQRLRRRSSLVWRRFRL